MLLYNLMSHSIHDEERPPVGEDVDKGPGVGEQASYNILNLDRVRPQDTSAHSAGSEAASIMPKDPRNSMY